MTKLLQKWTRTAQREQQAQADLLGQQVKRVEKTLFQRFRTFFDNHPTVRYNEVSYASELTFDRLFIPPEQCTFPLFHRVFCLLPAGYGLALVYHVDYSCAHNG